MQSTNKTAHFFVLLYHLCIVSRYKYRYKITADFKSAAAKKLGFSLNIFLFLSEIGGKIVTSRAKDN